MAERLVGLGLCQTALLTNFDIQGYKPVISSMSALSPPPFLSFSHFLPFSHSFQACQPFPTPSIHLLSYITSAIPFTNSLPIPYILPIPF